MTDTYSEVGISLCAHDDSQATLSAVTLSLESEGRLFSDASHVAEWQHWGPQLHLDWGQNVARVMNCQQHLTHLFKKHSAFGGWGWGGGGAMGKVLVLWGGGSDVTMITDLFYV